MQKPPATHASAASQAALPSDGRPRLWAIGLLIVVVSLAYSNSFTGRFVGLDAKQSIRDNHHIQTLWPLSEAMSLSLVDETIAADTGSKGGTLARRPILSLSFALNHAILGPSANGFHAVNLLLHLLVALALFGILRRTLARGSIPLPPWLDELTLATAITAIWALHPVQTEAVTYLVQRAECLMALFLTFTLYCSIRYLEAPRSWLWLGAAVASCALGMGTKEVGVVAPVVVLTYDATFLSRGWRDALGRHIRLYLPLAATWLVMVALILATLEDASRDFQEGRNLQYALVQPRILFHYLRLAFWPHPLHLYINTSVFDTTPLVTQLACAVFVLTAGLVVVRAFLKRHWLGFVGAWFFIILAPSSTIVATSDVVQAHRIYLPLLSAIVGAATVFLVILDRTPMRAGTAKRKIAATVFSVWALVLAGITHQRNLDYYSEFGAVHPADVHEAMKILASHYITRNALAEAGTDAERTLADESALGLDRTFSHLMLALDADRRGDVDETSDRFDEVFAAAPSFGYAHSLAGDVWTRRGDWDRAVEHYEVAVSLDPTASAHNDLGRRLTDLGRLDEAARHFEAVIALRPYSATGYNNMGFLLEKNGRPREAQSYYERGVAVDPLDVMARANLARIQAASGRADLAVQNMETLVAQYPDREDLLLVLIGFLETAGRIDEAMGRLEAIASDTEASAAVLIRLGSLKEKAKAWDDALEAYRRASLADPRSAVAAKALGSLLGKTGRGEEAIGILQTSLRLAPDDVETRLNLGTILALHGRAEEAQTHFERAVILAPERPLANFNLALTLIENKDPSAAERHLRRELELSPSYAPAHLHLANILSARGAEEEAARHFERAQILDPRIQEP